MLGAVSQLESSLAEKGLGVLVDTKLNISQQSALVRKDANTSPSCIRQSIPSRLKEVILPFYAALVRPQLKYCVHSWALQYKREKELMERDQAMKTIKGLQHLSCEERLRQMGLFSPEKRRLGTGGRTLPIPINTWMENENRRETASFQWCPVTKQEAMGTNWNVGASTWTSGEGDKLGSALLENSEGERDLGWTAGWPRASTVPLCPRRPMASWGVLAGLWLVGQERFSSPSTLPWWDCIWNIVSSSGPLSSRRTGNCLRESIAEPQGLLKKWSISLMRKGWGSCVSLAWRRGDQGVTLLMFININIKGWVSGGQSQALLSDIYW